MRTGEAHRDQREARERSNAVRKVSHRERFPRNHIHRAGGHAEAEGDRDRAGGVRGAQGMVVSI